MGLFQRAGKKFWKVGLMFSIFFLMSSQTSAFSLEKSQNYLSVLYNNNNGLPTSEANDIQQTEDGYIWIGSYSGLLRYDGKDFVAIEEPKGLTSIFTLFKDSKNRLWVGTNNNGVAVYENREFTFIDASAHSDSYSVRGISEHDNGDILIGTTSGMYVINSQFQVSPIDDDRMFEAYISELCHLGENRTLAVTKSGSLFVLDHNTVEFYLDIQDWNYALPLCALLLEDAGGEYLLLGTSENYLVKVYYKEDTPIFQEISTENLSYINTLTQDSEGKVWIGSDSGLGYLDKLGNLRTLDYITNGDSIESILEDREGNFWLASSKEGVIKLTPSIFKNISGAISDLPQVNGVEVLDGLIYLVSTNGIDILELESLKPVENDFSRQFEGVYIRCVQKDQEGNLWFSSYSDHGLIKYTPKTNEITYFNYSNGLDYSRIRSTMSANDGKIWVATGNGVYVIEHNEIIAHYGREDGLENVEILTLAEDKKGRVFVGTDGAGVYIIENEKMVKSINREHGLTSDIIMRIEADPVSNGMWFVTGNAISYYDEEETVQNIDKFPYGNNFDLLFFETNMAILSSNGVYFTTRDSMLGDSEELDYTHKNHLDGLFSSLVANSFSTIDNNILYLCGTQNLSAISLTADSFQQMYAPPVQVLSIGTEEGQLFPDENNLFSLPFYADYIELDVLIPTYSLQDYQVSYTMVGYDQTERSSSYENFQDPTYTNLPGGTYDFIIELTDNRTNKVISRGEFQIEKAYNLYEHPLFQLVALSSILLLTWGFIVLVTKTRDRKEKEEKRIQQALLDEVVEVFSNVIDVKDKYTNGHSRRVAVYTREIAVALLFSEERVNELYKIALLHDVGKIAIPDEVLNKPSRLSEEEYAIMKLHTENGANILKAITTWPEIAIGAKYHHERYDGGGTYQLKGEEIPLDARIICVADAFDAMYSSRSYSKKTELSFAVGQLVENKGTQFDPEIVDTFVNLIEKDKLSFVFNKTK